MDKNISIELNSLTKQEKLDILKIPSNKRDYFTDVAVDTMFEQFKQFYKIEDTKATRLLYLLNELLKECGCEYVESIEDFKIKRNVLTKIDGIKFVDTYKITLNDYGIHINNDLHYLSRNVIKTYSLTVLKDICKFFGYITKRRQFKDGTYYTVIKDI